MNAQNGKKMQNVEFRMTGLASHFNFQVDIFVKPDGANL